MAEQTRRELLEAAWDKNEAGEDDDDVAVLGEQDSDSSVVDGGDGADAGSLDEGTGKQVAGDDSAGQKISDGDRKDVKGKKDAKAKEVGKKPAADPTQSKEAAAAREDEQGAAEGDGAPATDKAPQSWKPAAREHWGKIPAEARTEINRRELQVQQTLSQTAQVRKFAGDFASTVQPFSHLIRSQHATPLAAVKNLMETAAGLMQGNTSQKASIVAEIIGNYGVDVEELDRILSELANKNGGKIPSRTQQPIEQIPSWARPMMQSHEQLEQAKYQREERMRQEAEAAVIKAESKPFFNDVADDVSDIMEIAARRGVEMTIDQAYEKAIKLNPEVSKIIAQRARSAAALKGNKNITRARRASSTIAGAPSGKVSGVASGDKPSRRQQLSEAWDEAT